MNGLWWIFRIRVILYIWHACFWGFVVIGVPFVVYAATSNEDLRFLALFVPIVGVISFIWVFAGLWARDNVKESK
jgi:hypothetical protein